MSLQQTVAQAKEDIQILEQAVVKCHNSGVKQRLREGINDLEVMVAKAEGWLGSTNTGRQGE